MAIGYYLARGDKTACGGVIIEGCEDHTFYDRPAAREGDRVTCGKHPGRYRIAGGIESDTLHGRMMAGTLDSISACPCRSRFVPSLFDDTYEKTTTSGHQMHTEQNVVQSAEVQQLTQYFVIRGYEEGRHDRPTVSLFTEEGETP